MARYLLMASYSPEGIKGLLKDGGSARREVVKKVARSLGGKMVTFDYAFGDTDVYTIIDLPDHASSAALSLSVGATGAVSIKTVPLITPEEIDEAAQKSVNYRPPGG